MLCLQRKAVALAVHLAAGADQRPVEEAARIDPQAVVVDRRGASPCRLTYVCWVRFTTVGASVVAKSWIRTPLVFNSVYVTTTWSVPGYPWSPALCVLPTWVRRIGGEA